MAYKKKSPGRLIGEFGQWTREVDYPGWTQHGGATRPPHKIQTAGATRLYLKVFKSTDRVKLVLRQWYKQTRTDQPDYMYEHESALKSFDIDANAVDAIVDGLMLAREYFKGNVKKEEMNG